jgi:GH18 family chitinase
MYSQIDNATFRGDWKYSDDMSTGYMAPILTSNESRQLISYDNEESIQIKCHYIKAEGLGGAMVYALGFDAVHGDAINQPLLSTVGRELLGAGTP